MKNIFKTLALIVLITNLISCSSVRVAEDYDTTANFNDYKTFAFFKTGIDKAEISDLDKRRILRAIEAELLAKGLTKSNNPDMLVSLFTKSEQRVDVFNNNIGFGGWGWGWGWNQQPFVSTTTQGYLYIDLLDANRKELIWQGVGTGFLSRNMKKKERRIKEFVSKVMTKYPPEIRK